MFLSWSKVCDKQETLFQQKVNNNLRKPHRFYQHESNTWGEVFCCTQLVFFDSIRMLGKAWDLACCVLGGFNLSHTEFCCTIQHPLLWVWTAARELLRIGSGNDLESHMLQWSRACAWFCCEWWTLVLFSSGVWMWYPAVAIQIEEFSNPGSTNGFGACFIFCQYVHWPLPMTLCCHPWCTFWFWKLPSI